MQRRELSEDQMRAVTKVYDFARKIKKNETNLKAGKLTAVERIVRAYKRGDPLPTGFQHLREGDDLRCRIAKTVYTSPE